jgi:hypothetical protein
MFFKASRHKWEKLATYLLRTTLTAVELAVFIVNPAMRNRVVQEMHTKGGKYVQLLLGLQPESFLTTATSTLKMEAAFSSATVSQKTTLRNTLLYTQLCEVYAGLTTYLA